eukprot:RCo014517
MESFLGAYRGQHRFGYVHLNDGHNENPWALEPLDHRLAEFLAGTGAKHSPVFAILADHGLPYGYWAMTMTGEVEARNGINLLLLPRELARAFEGREIWQHNSQSLVTPHDMYRTLAELPLYLASKNRSDAHLDQPAKVGINLLRNKVPANRTCQNVDISPMLCICNLWAEAPSSTGADADKSARLGAAVGALNAITRAHSSCRPLQPLLFRILGAFELRGPSEGSQAKPVLAYRLQFEYMNFSEAGIRYVIDAVWEKSTDPTPSLTRRSAYVKQRKCGAGLLLEPFCVCR